MPALLYAGAKPARSRKMNSNPALETATLLGVAETVVGYTCHYVRD